MEKQIPVSFYLSGVLRVEVDTMSVESKGRKSK